MTHRIYNQSSPVATDHSLKKGYPFTDFGVLGEGALDVRVFEQDVFWVDVTGKPYFLIEMPTEYLVNVEAFLRTHQDKFYSEVKATDLEKMTSVANEADELKNMVEDWQNKWESLYDDAEEWLLNTPLHTKITKLIMQRLVPTFEKD